jgi:hypothetical protein
MNTSEKPQLTRPNCLSCRHFYITYEPAHPYGCRAMNFKSKEMPSLVVFRNSGMDCQAFCVK